MNAARYADRIWMGAGVVGVALLVLLGWLIFIQPKNSDTDDIRGRADGTQVQLITLQRKLTELSEKKKQLPKFEAKLEALQSALPTGSGLPDFLRQLQAAGSAVGVAVDGVTVTTPEKAASVANVYALPITVSATGKPADLTKFLDQLQTVQSRAVLVEGTNLTVPAEGSDDKSTLTITMRAFVAPGEGQPAPTVSASSSTASG